MNRNTKTLALILATAISLPALAHQHSAHPHKHTHQVKTENHLSDCVIQEVLPGKNMTAAFFTLHHHGTEQTLIKASIPSITTEVQLHRMSMKGDVMQMEEMKAGYAVKKGENQFARGGNHLMLMGIEKSPEVGSEHTLTLTFKDGSTISCQAKVKSVDEIMKMPQGKMHHEHSEHHQHMPKTAHKK